MTASLIFLGLSFCLIFIAVLYPVAIKIGLTDKPCHRKQHKAPTPLIGGLAIYMAITLMLLIRDLAFPHVMAYWTASTLLIGIGLLDDYKGLGVKIRFLAQFAAGLIMTEIADIKITHLGDLLVTGNIELGGFATLFTLFAVIGGINAFNMIDGIDGLAGSLALVTTVSLAVIGWLSGDMVLFNFCSVIVAALLAFLVFNLRIFGYANARIFLGDTGSTFLGYTLCWLAISASGSGQALIKPATVLWIIAIPLFDSVCIMVRRLSRARSPFEPDREHLHHIMSLTGYSVNQVVKRVASYGLIMAAIGISADLLFNVPDAIMLLLFLGLFICHYWGMNYSWMILKTTRYLRTRRKIEQGIDLRRQREERRVMEKTVEADQRILLKRRTQKERRFVPTDQDLSKFYHLEEKMENPDYPLKLKDKITIFWLNLYIGSK